MSRTFDNLSSQWARFAVALALLAVLTPILHAQQGDWCCFANRRFSGLCTVVPAANETCATVRSYLNNLSSTGKTYCGFTDIRMGWNEVPCSQTTPGSSGVFMEERQTLQPVSPTTAPGAVPVVTIPPGSVMTVSFDQTVDLGPSDQEFSGQLSADLVHDGSVIAPSGSNVYGHVSRSDWGEDQPMLELTEIEIDDQRRPVACGYADTVAEGQLPTIGVRLDASLTKLDHGQQVTFGPTIPLLLEGEVVDMTRQAVQSQRQAILAATLELTDDESLDFWPVYKEYRSEMTAVSDRYLAMLNSYADSYYELTDEQALSLLDEALAIDQARLDITKSYRGKLAAILPAKKVARFYQVENKVDAVIDAELAQVIPLVR